MDALEARACRPDFAVWRGQVARAGFCVRPVRVSGRAAAVDTSSGEVLAQTSTADAPDGVLLVACGDRRAAVCPPCSRTYRADAWHMIAAGMRGRTPTGEDDAVPSSVGEHPALFLTLTAPGFGAVHAARDGGAPCRLPRGRKKTCPHGRPAGCGLVHEPDHPAVGTPVCPDCWDYTGAVLWNASLGELWRRTRIGIERALAPAASAALGRRVGVREVSHLLRVSYVKVVEFQRRGLAHVHAVLRLDGVVPGDRSALLAPPSWATAELLASAVRSAVASTAFALPSPDGVARVAEWGSQLDVRPLDDPAKAAGYLAKYATKTVDADSDALARRLRRLDRAALTREVGPHLARMVATCWELGKRRDLSGLRLRRWAHCLGYRGHFTTKSRAYSLTLGVLRAVRRAWRARQSRKAGRADVWGLEGAEVVGAWAYAGSGYLGAADVLIAHRMAQDHAVARAEYKAVLRREAQMAVWAA
ncbi:replication initiator [Nocardiopsis sp. CNT-189]|uniref:replication initiator n=1 Tax=Nocardiopsis oceanisediminis TaxID=2816862 RepID=UPI003B3AB2A1